MTRLSGGWCWAILAVVSSAPVAAGQDRSTIGSGDLAALQRDAFRGAAVQAMRVRRMASIGRLCGLLSAQDDAAIRASADAMLADERSLLAPGDAAMAETYLDGLRDGAFRAADLRDVTDAASCRRFAEPGGALDRILTWNGKPPRTVNGVLMSPRTTP
jgi:hypothetical protein